MSKPIVAIVQARMGSSRLPGKVLLPLLKQPVLWHIVQRLRQVAAIDEVLVATSTEEQDEAVATFCRQENILCFRGSEADVLDRFYQAARWQEAGQVIRITGDCPLIDPLLVDRLILQHLRGGCDYTGVAAGAGVANDKGGRFPDGLDAEIFSMATLTEAWRNSVETLHREHVTPFIWQQPQRFHLGVLRSDQDYGELRWTLDHREDYQLICWIYEQLFSRNSHFGMKEILDLLDANRQKIAINKAHIGRENYHEFWKNAE